jgi:hypothetical protein
MATPAKYYLVESGGWLKILIWALIGAVVVTGMVFCLSGCSFVNALSPLSRRRGPFRVKRHGAGWL